ncbi:hypothetical protein ACFY97_04420 [Streptomyces klenkii]|uniref:hypothetical protein n=1 Tax=Streptomyces klenkii TaxID=1420899 RepID=UPI0036E49ABC
MPTYTGADAQKGCEEALTKQVEDADRLATRKCLAEYEKRLRDNGLWVVRGQYELCKYGAVTEALIEPADAALSGTTRLVDPAPDRARVGWGRVGGSNALDGWRADAQLIVDITPVPGTTDVTVTARLRGVGVRRDNAGVWNRTGRRRAAHRTMAGAAGAGQC